MQIEAAIFGRVEDGLRQDHAIGDDHGRIGVVRAKISERLGVFQCGWRETGMPSRLASISTGVGCSFMPRPAGFAARVYTAAISWPWATSSSSVGTANSGVPMKIKRSGMT
jgi:hypothetical protein